MRPFYLFYFILYRSSEVSGVFGSDSERAEDGVRRGHPCRPLPSARQEEREEVYGVLKKKFKKKKHSHALIPSAECFTSTHSHHTEFLPADLERRSKNVTGETTHTGVYSAAGLKISK